MRIYEYLEFDAKGNIIDEISYDYQGKVAQCKGGGGGTTTTEPPDWLKQYMPMVGERGWDLAGKEMSYYPGVTTAGFTPEQLQAQGMTSERAMGGSPLLGASKEYASDTLSGRYLNPDTNPALAGLMKSGMEQIMPNVDAQSGGRYGSDTWALMKGKALADVASNVYNPERERMQGMSTIAPQLDQMDYFDIGKLAAVGEEKQGMKQALINEQVKRHEFSQLEPWQRLGMFTNLVSGDWGGTTSSTGGGK